MVKEIKIKEISTDTLSCEPLIKRVKNGELLCVVQQGGVGEPMPENRVNVYHSRDNGESWFGGESIYPETGKAVYATELQAHGDEITAYLAVHSGGFLDCKNVVVKSFDNGYTWKETGSAPHFPTHAFMRGAIKTRNNQIVMPYHYFGITQEEYERVMNDKNLPIKNIAHAQAKTCETGVLIREANGEDWKRYTACVIDMTKYGMTWSEPTIAQTKDDQIIMLMRHERTGFLYRSHSTDGGKTWSEFTQTDIPNPTNKVKLIALSKDRIALVHTPNGKLNEEGYGRREPFEMWISCDGMKTWAEKIRLTNFPGEYHYSDGFYEDGHVRLVVEHNRHTVLYFDIEID